MLKSRLLMFAAALPSLASAQLYTGTAVVAMYNRSDLVIAADSQNNRTSVDGTTNSSINACKLRVFGKKVVFAASGVYGDSVWNVDQLAQEAIGNMQVRDLDTLKLAGTLWADAVKAKLGTVERNSLRVQGEKLNTSAFFAMQVPDVGIVVLRVRVDVDLASPSNPNVVKTMKVVQNGEADGGMSTLGYATDAINELNAGTSARALAQRPLKGLIAGANNVDLMVAGTLGLAKLSSAWFPKVVGGPLDQLHIGAAGITWLRVKPECAQ